jgi:ribosomal-protein-alanine acetyltransferase
MMNLDRAALTAGHWSRQQYESLFLATGASPTWRLVLLVENEDESEPAGFLVGHAVGEEWELENIVVAEGRRRHGLGSRLLEEFLGLARGQGAKAVFLEVRESNQAARSVYERLAFEKTGVRAGYYQGPAEDALTYRLTFLNSVS